MAPLHQSASVELQTSARGRLLRPAEACVRYADTHTVGTLTFEHARAIISDDERAHCDRLGMERDRREYAIAHALLRRTLSEFSGLPPKDWRFALAPNGKPTLAAHHSATPLTFNLTHTHGLAACIVAHGAAVGIDAELMTRAVDWLGIARRYFSPGELREIEQVAAPHQPRTFLELWTLKEAFAKTTGRGLSHALGDASFDLRQDRAIMCTLPPTQASGTWHIATYAPTRAHVLTIAINDDNPGPWTVIVSTESSAPTLEPCRVSTHFYGSTRNCFASCSSCRCRASAR